MPSLPPAVSRPRPHYRPPHLRAHNHRPRHILRVPRICCTQQTHAPGRPPHLHRSQTRITGLSHELRLQKLYPRYLHQLATLCGDPNPTLALHACQLMLHLANLDPTPYRLPARSPLRRTYPTWSHASSPVSI